MGGHSQSLKNPQTRRSTDVSLLVRCTPRWQSPLPCLLCGGGGKCGALPGCSLWARGLCLGVRQCGLPPPWTVGVQELGSLPVSSPECLLHHWEPCVWAHSCSQCVGAVTFEVPGDALRSLLERNPLALQIALRTSQALAGPPPRVPRHWPLITGAGRCGPCCPPS